MHVCSHVLMPIGAQIGFPTDSAAQALRISGEPYCGSRTRPREPRWPPSHSPAITLPVAFHSAGLAGAGSRPDARRPSLAQPSHVVHGLCQRVPRLGWPLCSRAAHPTTSHLTSLTTRDHCFIPGVSEHTLSFVACLFIRAR